MEIIGDLFLYWVLVRTLVTQSAVTPKLIFPSVGLRIASDAP